jgi:hypothetical protein
MDNAKKKANGQRLKKKVNGQRLKNKKRVAGVSPQGCDLFALFLFLFFRTLPLFTFFLGTLPLFAFFFGTLPLFTFFPRHRLKKNET